VGVEHFVAEGAVEPLDVGILGGLAWLDVVKVDAVGHSKDHRPDLRQMIVGIAVDSESRLLCCEMWPGNTTDVRTFPAVVQRKRARFRVQEFCVVGNAELHHKRYHMRSQIIGHASQAIRAAGAAVPPPVREVE
jgi:hypothetical protein